jgi:CDGSH-type Zn-finger protein/uncharacterized Fe-S cluster protein YjdI
MTSRTRVYSGENIDVTYDVARCIHAAACVKGLPSVFNTQARPWVQPDNADSDAVAEVVVRCPTGALHYKRKDGGPAEGIPDANTIEVTSEGPLYVRGDVTIAAPDGRIVLKDVRMALCRCGASGNKPFCDNSHQQIDFVDAGILGANGLPHEPQEEPTPLHISPSTNGPLLIQGNVALRGTDGTTVYSLRRITLCRCGASANKPFCDGSHSHIGFQS